MKETLKKFLLYYLVSVLSILTLIGFLALVDYLNLDTLNTLTTALVTFLTDNLINIFLFVGAILFPANEIITSKIKKG